MGPVDAPGALIPNVWNYGFSARMMGSLGLHFGYAEYIDNYEHIYIVTSMYRTRR